MAAGDAGAAKGLATVAPTAPANKAADDHNTTRDYIAAEIDARTAAVAGVQASLTAGGIRSNGVYGDGNGTSNVQNDLQYLWQHHTDLPDSFDVDFISYSGGGRQSFKNYVNGTFGDINNRINNAQGTASDGQNQAVAARQGYLYADPYNRNITGTRRAAWLQSDGQLGYASSSERYKTAIRLAHLNPQAILALEPVLYSYSKQVELHGDDAPTEVGLIAERLDEAGLWPFVIYNEDGTAEGIVYEIFAVAVLAACQYVNARVDELEARLAALEASAD